VSQVNQNMPAVVVGGGLNALGIVRSLGQAGIPLIVVDTDLKSPAMRSRFGRKVVCAALDGDAFLACLQELARGRPARMMLFVTEEKSVIAISELRAALEPHFFLRLPEHERLMALMHKQGFQDLAESVAAPVPRTVRLQGPQDLPLADTLTYPCVFKPSKKSYTYGALFKKAYKVASPREVGELYERIHPVLADMVVQEWIEGTDAEVFFCLQYVGQDGEAVSSFAGRKIRSWPPRIGGTASCTAAWDVDQELKAMTTTFFRQVGFTGMGSMEYKRDARDGRFYMVEPTVARTDFQEEVASLNGVNIPQAAYLYESGLPQVAPRKPAVPQVWREPLCDRWSFEEGGGQVDQASRSHTVRDAFWRWNDPLPWVDMMAARVRSKLGRKA
jgi:D-aspartate ligase